MRAVGKTPNGFKSIRISSHTPKNIQEGSAEIICEDIDILSNPSPPPPSPGVAQNIHFFRNHFSTPLLNVLRGMWWYPDKFQTSWSLPYSAHCPWFFLVRHWVLVIIKMRKRPYLSPGASNPKNKGTFISSTLNFEEKKVPLFFGLEAPGLRYGHFLIFLVRHWVFKTSNGRPPA